MENKLEEVLEVNLESILKIAFQPIYSLKSNEVMYEVLARFYSEKLGEIPTLTVVNFLEKLNIIYKLDFLILKKAEIHLKKNKKIAVNISPTTMLRKEFMEKLLSLDCDLSNLEIEIVEREKIDYNKLSIIIKELKKKGVKIAMDDFPIENSNLENLLKINIDKVKIDKSLLKNIDCDLDKDIYMNIINLLKKMKNEIVIEGVETKEELNFIKKTKADFVQGYYLGKPILESDKEF